MSEKTINIHIDKIIDKIVVSGDNADEIYNKMEKQLFDIFTKVLDSANKLDEKPTQVKNNNKKAYMATFSILEEAKINSQSIDKVIENLTAIKKEHPNSEITGVFVAHNLKLV